MLLSYSSSVCPLVIKIHDPPDGSIRGDVTVLERERVLVENASCRVSINLLAPFRSYDVANLGFISRNLSNTNSRPHLSLSDEASFDSFRGDLLGAILCRRARPHPLRL